MKENVDGYQNDEHLTQLSQIFSYPFIASLMLSWMKVHHELFVREEYIDSVRSHGCMKDLRKIEISPTEKNLWITHEDR